MKSKQDGVILITVIFFMVILLLIGIGISTISNRGLEDSVITKKVSEDEILVDGLVNVGKADINEQSYSKMEMHMFVDDKPKNFKLEVKNNLKNSIIIVSSSSGWDLNSFTKIGAAGEITRTVITSSGIYNEYKIEEDLIGDQDYKIRATGGSGQYKIQIKGFYN